MRTGVGPSPSGLLHLLLAIALGAIAACSAGDPPREAPAPPPSAPPPPSALPGPSAAPPSPPSAPPEGMALVPGGPFTMGADHGGEEDEHPAHTVTVAAFYLDLTEVSNAAWDRCVAAKVCPPPDATSATRNGFGGDPPFRGPHQPVSSVSWDEARAYCAWRGLRLPTESEWEKAARGTDGRRYPWGDDEPTADRAVFGGATLTRDVGTHPKGQGPYGHLDLAGNVWEWVEDLYDPYAYRRAAHAQGRGSTCEQAREALDEIRAKHKRGFTGSNPVPTECERVLRGGAFNYQGAGLRSSNRVHHPGRYHLIMSGFRCAKDAGP